MAGRDALLRDYQWVNERLAVGSAVTEAAQVDALVSDGITHVIDCRMGKAAAELYQGTSIRYFHNPTSDDRKSKTNDWFFKGLDFFHKAMDKPRSKVLVHCRFGMSRGPTLTYAILRSLGAPAEAALKQVCEARPVAKVTYLDDADRAASAWKQGRRG